MGQRQLHSVTGLVPGGAERGTPEYIAALKGINAGRLGTLAKRIEKSENPKPTLLQRALGREAKPNPRRIAAAQNAYVNAVQGANAGQTSLMGIGQNFAEKGLKGGFEDMSQGVKNRFANTGVVGKALAGGSLLVPAALNIGRRGGLGDTDEEVGSSLGGAVTGTAAGALTPLLGSTGGNIVRTGARRVGETMGSGIGRAVGALRAKKEDMRLGAGNVTPGAQPDLSAPPVQREYSNSAIGKPPEGLMI
jgi:hypothetical protein